MSVCVIFPELNIDKDCVFQDLQVQKSPYGLRVQLTASHLTTKDLAVQVRAFQGYLLASAYCQKSPRLKKSCSFYKEEHLCKEQVSFINLNEFLYLPRQWGEEKLSVYFFRSAVLAQEDSRRFAALWQGFSFLKEDFNFLNYIAQATSKRVAESFEMTATYYRTFCDDAQITKPLYDPQMFYTLVDIWCSLYKNIYFTT